MRTSQWISIRTIVDCSVPHAHEVVATKAFDTSVPYPGVNAMSARSGLFCEQAVQTAGLNRQARSWSISTLYPSQCSWESGRAVAVCFASHRVTRTGSVFA